MTYVDFMLTYATPVVFLYCVVAGSYFTVLIIRELRRLYLLDKAEAQSAFSDHVYVGYLPDTWDPMTRTWVRGERVEIKLP